MDNAIWDTMLGDAPKIQGTMPTRALAKRVFVEEVPVALEEVGLVAVEDRLVLEVVHEEELLLVGVEDGRVLEAPVEVVVLPVLLGRGGSIEKGLLTFCLIRMVEII